MSIELQAEWSLGRGEMGTVPTFCVLGHGGILDCVVRLV